MSYTGASLKVGDITLENLSFVLPLLTTGDAGIGAEASKPERIASGSSETTSSNVPVVNAEAPKRPEERLPATPHRSYRDEDEVTISAASSASRTAHSVDESARVALSLYNGSDDDSEREGSRGRGGHHLSSISSPSSQAGRSSSSLPSSSSASSSLLSTLLPTSCSDSDPLRLRNAISALSIAYRSLELRLGHAEAEAQRHRSIAEEELKRADRAREEAAQAAERAGYFEHLLGAAHEEQMETQRELARLREREVASMAKRTGGSSASKYQQRRSSYSAAPIAEEEAAASDDAPATPPHSSSAPFPFASLSLDVLRGEVASELTRQLIILKEQVKVKDGAIRALQARAWDESCAAKSVVRGMRREIRRLNEEASRAAAVSSCKLAEARAQAEGLKGQLSQAREQLMAAEAAAESLRSESSSLRADLEASTASALSLRQQVAWAEEAIAVLHASTSDLGLANRALHEEVGRLRAALRAEREGRASATVAGAAIATDEAHDSSKGRPLPAHVVGNASSSSSSSLRLDAAVQTTSTLASLSEEEDALGAREVLVSQLARLERLVEEQQGQIAGLLLLLQHSGGNGNNNSAPAAAPMPVAAEAAAAEAAAADAWMQWLSRPASPAGSGDETSGSAVVAAFCEDQRREIERLRGQVAVLMQGLQVQQQHQQPQPEPALFPAAAVVSVAVGTDSDSDAKMQEQLNGSLVLRCRALEAELRSKQELVEHCGRLIIANDAASRAGSVNASRLQSNTSAADNNNTNTTAAQLLRQLVLETTAATSNDDHHLEGGNDDARDDGSVSDSDEDEAAGDGHGGLAALSASPITNKDEDDDEAADKDAEGAGASIFLPCPPLSLAPISNLLAHHRPERCVEGGDEADEADEPSTASSSSSSSLLSSRTDASRSCGDASQHHLMRSGSRGSRSSAGQPTPTLASVTSRSSSVGLNRAFFVPAEPGLDSARSVSSSYKGPGVATATSVGHADDADTEGPLSVSASPIANQAATPSNQRMESPSLLLAAPASSAVAGSSGGDELEEGNDGAGEGEVDWQDLPAASPAPNDSDAYRYGDGEEA